MDNNQDGSEVLETTEETVEQTTDTTEETTQEETSEEQEQLTPEEIQALKEKAAKADKLESQNKKLFERAKRAETKVVQQPTVPQELSNKDMIYLAKADIHVDDIDDVIEMAKLKKLTVAEAHTFMSPILKVRQEERRTANATSTGKSARGTTKISGEQILNKANQTGEVPDSEEGLQALFQARMAQKLKK